MDDWWDRREWHICMYMVEMVEMDEALEQKALLGAACQGMEVWAMDGGSPELPAGLDVMGGGLWVALNEESCWIEVTWL